uniref:TTF-type domain-containing protein n=1 Tax=Gossypium raimondii TaxID=29730 RepID=A0A0D2R9E0_GOSRA|nr:hypothetical protein B456_002G197900 [Gossypium raimondii]
MKKSEYPLSSDKHPRRFQSSWFCKFPWLEYSPTKDAIYCFSCYLFSKHIVRHETDAFTVKGFNNWKKVNDGKMRAFLNHVGKYPSSPHNNAKKSCQDLLNQSWHIDKTSFDVVRWLTLQGCAFRGHDETSNSRNQGNFLELMTLLASYNDKVSKVVLENAPRNAKYTSHMIQKETLHILANKAHDESKRKQMIIVLRDEKGFIKEHLFDLVHVQDIATITLKEEICVVLFWHCLDAQNIRGQGYDGASNMRGEWNSLQSLFLNDWPYICYVIPVHNFFSNLNFIVNIISAFCKRHDQLLVAQAIEIANMLEIDELENDYNFDFVFILYLVREIIGIIDILCQHLQKKNPKIKEDDWDNLLEVVKAFCEKRNIEVLDMDSPYVIKCCRHHVDFNLEHHYGVEVFNAAIDSQLLELNSRFNERTISLLILSSALDPKDAYKSFNMESAFSAMKIVKTRLLNKMEDEFLTNNLVYIEREIVETFDSDSIFSDFISLKERRAQF